MKELIGKVVQEIYIDKARETITFVTDAGVLQYVADGDCCSHSWIEHIAGVQEILNQKIDDVEEVKACSNIEGMITSKGKGDHVDVYFYRLRVEGGWRPEFTIDLRNDSNGYYGGSLEFTGEVTDGSYQRNAFDTEWKNHDKLVGDF